jgi:hypothetical protein
MSRTQLPAFVPFLNGASPTISVCAQGVRVWDVWRQLELEQLERAIQDNDMAVVVAQQQLVIQRLFDATFFYIFFFYIITNLVLCTDWSAS